MSTEASKSQNDDHFTGDVSLKERSYASVSHQVGSKTPERAHEGSRFEDDLRSIGAPSEQQPRGAFMQVRQALQQRFPGMEVVGSNYPVPAFRTALARLTTAVQLGVVGVMTLGDQLFAYLGMEPPALYVANRERRVGVCLGAWLLGNAAHNALTATGAFEVFYDGRLVFSKLESGRVPNVSEVLTAVAALQGRDSD